jgi:Uma2 family endonuclease
MANAEYIPEPHRYTYGDYVQWSDEERWELIDGIPYCLAAPSVPHQRILGELFRQLANQLEGHRCQALLAPVDVRLPERPGVADKDIDTTVQPDIMVVCDPAKMDEKGVRGAPDFLIEIFSPSTARRDREDKAQLYERHRVREYWMADPETRSVEVLLLGADEKWQAPRRFSAGEKVALTVLPSLTIDLGTVFPRT